MKMLGVVLCVMGMPVAWADYQSAPPGRVDLTELTAEFTQVVSDLTCTVESRLLSCTKLMGSADFTPEERVAMDALLAAHDPDIRAKRLAQQDQQRQQKAQALRQKLGLTPQEFQDLKDSLGGP